MENLNVNDAIKIKILKQLSDEKVYSFYLLSKTIGANNTTVKTNSNFLHKIGLIQIDKVTMEESASGMPSYRVKITKEGLKAIGRASE